MVSQEGKNVKVVGIHGNFDDAQSAVKVAFGDKMLKEVIVKEATSYGLDRYEKIYGIKDFKSRKNGSVAYIDMSIFIDNNKTLEEAHNIADNLENDIISKLSYIKEINIHTEPYKG